MKTIIFILFPILGVLGILFYLQKIISPLILLLPTTIGSILSGFLSSLIFVYLIKLVIKTEIPLIEILLIQISLVINYTFFTDKNSIDYLSKVYLEGGFIGYIIFSIVYFFKYSPPFWF